MIALAEVGEQTLEAFLKVAAVFRAGQQRAKPQLKKPPLYRVVLLNDDYTPMEFVVQVLEQFFGMGREKATQVMLAVHTQGKGVCGIYPQDIADTKASQVNQCARDSGHPLLCEVEPSSDDEED